MTPILLTISAVLILCVLCSRLSNRMGIPMLLLFLGVGMLFGSDGLFRINFDDFAFAEQICSVCLLFIMFYGGFGTKWSAARPVAPQAVLLSTAGVVLTAGMTGAFCHYALGMEWWYGLLLGSVLGSTDAASVFSILRSRQLNLKYNTASLLEVESGSNDPCAYLLTSLLLTALEGQVGPAQVLLTLVRQLVLGAVPGILTAMGLLWLLDRLQEVGTGFRQVLVLAGAVLAYALPAALGGNGYLGVYLAGLWLGNARFQDKRAMVTFFDGLTSLAQVFTFFVLGLLCFPRQLPGAFLPALGVGIFLTFVGRPAVVALLLAPFRASLGQVLTVAWAGLRGAASIVFAITVVVADTPGGEQLFNMVFCVVLLSILFQGSLLPWVARRLEMIDDKENVLRTFSDYSDQADVRFLRYRLAAGHPWTGNALRTVILPPDTILAMVERRGQALVPSGDTVLEPGDELVLASLGREGERSLPLREVEVRPGSDWCGKTLAQADTPRELLVILIKRGEKVVIPRGSTLLQAGDVLVMAGGRFGKPAPDNS